MLSTYTHTPGHCYIIFVWILRFFILILYLMSASNENDSSSFDLLQAAQANDVKRIEHYFACADMDEIPSQIDMMDPDGVRPIMYASFYGNLMFVQQLIRAGADINCVEKRKWTPLMYAVRYGRLDVTQELVMNSANLELANDDGHTALMIAAKYGQIDILNFLINHGAKLDHRDKDGLSAIDLAQEKGYKIIVETLKNRFEEWDKA
jgi:ankyrin repeat protein